MASQGDVFHQTLYEQSFQEIKSLQQILPEDTIASLAREVLRHVAERANAVKIAPTATLAQQVEKLAKALISDDADAGAEMIRNVHGGGTSLDDVYLLHLAEAARKLGVWWETDRISLVDVTIGTGRIYAIMRGLARLYPVHTDNSQKTALFTAVQGETHTIGVKMAADLFRKNGWTIDLKLGAQSDTLAADIRDAPPRIIGLSAGGEHALEALARMIIAIRINSPATAILVSGQIVNEAPDAVRLMGPDSIVFDFDQVESEMERLWEKTAPA